MDDTATATSVATLSIIDTIIAGMAAIDPARLEFAEGAEPRDEGVEALAWADDYLRRMRCYHSQLAQEANDLGKEMADLIKDVLSFKGVRSMSSYLLSFFVDDNGRREKVERASAIEAELRAKRRMVRRVDELFWDEVRRRNPKLDEFDTVTIHYDWSFSGRSDDVDDFLGGLGKFAGGLEVNIGPGGTDVRELGPGDGPHGFDLGGSLFGGRPRFGDRPDIGSILDRLRARPERAGR
jgi:hypothetical protein